MWVLTAAEARAVDRAAIETFGIPSLLLMEHAARAVSDAAVASLARGGRAVVVTGSGNNGGDGYAAARLLHCAGIGALVAAVSPPASLVGDAATQAAIWSRLGGEVVPWSDTCLAGLGPGDVIVDALLGTGLGRPPAGAFADAIEGMNRARSRGVVVVSVDLPSGMSADTGRAPGVVVQADRTVTFGALKRGLVLGPGIDRAGHVSVADISIPPAALAGVVPRVTLLDTEAVQALLPRHARENHKGSYGHVLVVAGSEGKSGAAALCSRSALIGGAGLVSVAARPGVIPQVLAHAMEVMGQPLPGGGPLSLIDRVELDAAVAGKAAVLVGPGIPRGPETGALIGESLLRAGCPVVIDADGLNALAGETERLLDAAGEVVITPHPGEMARLAGCSVAAIQDDRIGTAQAFATAHRCTVVLKGARTVVAAANGDVAICPTGNPGMATAGSGDVLGGLVAALLARGMSGWDAARAAVYVHGLAGDFMVEKRGLSGLMAGDLLQGITEVWARWKA